jgi:flagellin
MLQASDITYETEKSIFAYAVESGYKTADLNAKTDASSVIHLDMSGGANSSLEISSGSTGEALGNLEDVSINYSAAGGGSTWNVKVGGVTYSGAVSNTLADNTASGDLVADDGSGNTIKITNKTGAAMSISSQGEANIVSQAVNDMLSAKNLVTFQVGVTNTDKIDIKIEDSSAAALGVATAKIDTVDNASSAIDAVQKAIDQVLANRADIGAYSSRFDKAYSSVTTSIQNQDAARGIYLDADIAAESTNLATAQVKMNASISVISQANDLTKALLKLVQ